MPKFSGVSVSTLFFMRIWVSMFSSGMSCVRTSFLPVNLTSASSASHLAVLNCSTGRALPAGWFGLPVARRLAGVAFGADGRSQVGQPQLVGRQGARQQRARLARAVAQRAVQVAGADGAVEVAVGPVPTPRRPSCRPGGPWSRTPASPAAARRSAGTGRAMLAPASDSFRSMPGQRARVGQRALDGDLVLAQHGVGLDREDARVRRAATARRRSCRRR